MGSMGDMSGGGGGGGLLGGDNGSLAALLNQPGMMPFSSFPDGGAGMADWIFGGGSGSGANGGLLPMDTDLGVKPFGGMDSFSLLEGTGQAPGVGGGDSLMFDASTGGAAPAPALGGGMPLPFGFGFDDSNMLNLRSDGGDESDDENGGSSQVRGTAMGVMGSLGGGESGGRPGGGGVTRATKRLRLVWTPELHHRFMVAVHQLGVNNAVPKALLQVRPLDSCPLVSTWRRAKFKQHLAPLASVPHARLPCTRVVMCLSPHRR